MADNPPLAELLGGLVNAVAVVAKLEVPDASDVLYFRNIPEYQQLNSSCLSKVQQLLHTAHSNLTRPSAAATSATHDDVDDIIDDVLFEEMSCVLDDSLERLDTALDAAHGQIEQLKLGGWATPAVGRQAFRAAARGLAGPAAYTNASTSKRVLRHVANMPRPQDSFVDPVDNSNTLWTPAKFQHVAEKMKANAAAASDAGKAAAKLHAHAAQLAAAAGSGVAAAAGAGHPYAVELSRLCYEPWQLQGPTLAAAAAADPPSLESVPFTLVVTPEDLAAMVATLSRERQLALDLEHHSYRSFQGFTCLLQLSTRSADYVVDALALRDVLGPALAAVLADPSIEKVLHGADSDVLWLQRDFGLYLVNMFDTGQAARVLNYPSASLAHLLERHTGFVPDKRYQLADWRLRPLPPDMLHYARCDTHYLLYVADLLKAELRAAGERVPTGWAVPVPPHSGAAGALGAVLERSRQITTTTYQKPLFSENSYLEVAARWSLALPPRNMAAFAALFAWRDKTARRLDESISYAMPKALLLELSRAMPSSAVELRRLLGQGSGLSGGAVVVLAHADEVVAAICSSQQQASGAGAPAAPAGTEAGSAELPAVGALPSRTVVVPSTLPAIKPKALPPLVIGRKAAGNRSTAGVAADGTGPAAQVSAAAPLTPAAVTASNADAKAAPEQQQQQMSDWQELQNSDDVPNEAPPGKCFLQPIDLQQQQQQHGNQQAAPSEQQCQQDQQQQQAGAAAESASSLPVPVPNQLPAAPKLVRKAGSTMAGLLSSGKQRQQQPPAHQPAAFQHRFCLPYLQPAGTSAAASEAAASPKAAEDSDKQQQQQPESGRSVVTGLQVRSLVDQLKAEAVDDERPGAAAETGKLGLEQQQEQHCAEKDTCSGADSDAEPPATAAAGLEDLDYLPLSAQHKNIVYSSSLQKRPHVPHSTARSSGQHADPPTAQPAEQKKRKRGIFHSAAGSDNSDFESSEDEAAKGGLMPAFNPAANVKARGQADEVSNSRSQHQLPQDGQNSSTAAALSRHKDDARGRGAGRRGARGGRRGGFLAAATASLAQVRKAQAMAGMGSNPFDIPDAHLMRGGKRKAVAPRGGNRSATFRQ